MPASRSASASGTNSTAKSSAATSTSCRLLAGQKYSGDAATPTTRTDAPRDRQAVCGREPEMRGRVVLDEHPVACRVATVEQVDAVDGRLRTGRDPDDPAEQPVGAELHRHVGLDARLHGGHPGCRPRALRELGDRAAGDGQVREAVAHERRVIGDLQAAIRLVGGAEQRDAQHDGHADGDKLRALAAQIAAQLAAQHPHQPSSRA